MYETEKKKKNFFPSTTRHDGDVADDDRPRPLLGSRRGVRRRRRSSRRRPRGRGGDGGGGGGGHSQPTRPRSRATGGRERVVDDGDPRDCLPSQLERTIARRAIEPPISARARARPKPRRRARRSGRVSGIRPSDRRGPGPVGHRGRNVRSTGRCSYNLRITRGRADSCGLHRSTSQVIRRSGSGVFVSLFVFIIYI